MRHTIHLVKPAFLAMDLSSVISNEARNEGHLEMPFSSDYTQQYDNNATMRKGAKRNSLSASSSGQLLVGSVQKKCRTRCSVRHAKQEKRRRKLMTRGLLNLRQKIPYLTNVNNCGKENGNIRKNNLNDVQTLHLASKYIDFLYQIISNDDRSGQNYATSCYHVEHGRIHDAFNLWIYLEVDSAEEEDQRSPDPCPFGRYSEKCPFCDEM